MDIVGFCMVNSKAIQKKLIITLRVLLPLMRDYLNSGEFTKWKRFTDSVLANLKNLVIGAVLLGAYAGYLFATGQLVQIKQ